MNLEDLKINIEKDFTEFMKDYYNLKVIVITSTSYDSNCVDYYYRTNKPLPELFQSNVYNSKKTATKSIFDIYRIMKLVKDTVKKSGCKAPETGQLKCFS